MIFVTSGFFAAVKAFKNVLFLVVINSDTCVRNSEQKVSVRSFPKGEYGSYVTVLGSVADGVMQQDCEHLRDALRVAIACGDGRVGEGNAEADIFFGSKALEGFASV